MNWRLSRLWPVSFGIVVVIASCACDRTPTAPGSTAVPPAPAAIRVLMITATAGFRHDAIPVAQNVMAALAARAGDVRVTATADLSSISAATLAGYDVLFFALTSGELPLASEQKAAMLAFVSDGKGFLGVHSATDTLYEWPEYGQLVGAYFNEHPWTQLAGVVVEDPSHPATAGLAGRFSISEEFYTFRDNPRGQVHVLLRLDAASVGSAGDYPLAWAHTYGSGRVYYNALGHFSTTWNDARFQQQLLGAVRWLARR